MFFKNSVGSEAILGKKKPAEAGLNSKLSSLGGLYLGQESDQEAA
jgi:hypothetical protein